MNPHEELNSLYLRLKEADPSLERGESLWTIFEDTTDATLRPLALWTFSQNQFDLGHFRSFLVSFSLLMDWVRKDELTLTPKQELDLYWNYKSYLIYAAEQEDMPVALLEEDFDRFVDFCDAHGFARTRDYIGFMIYSKLGDEEQADHYLSEWVDAPPDELSDCPSCEGFSRMIYAIERGYEDRALLLYAAIRHERGCSRMPDQAHPFILPLFISRKKDRFDWTEQLIQEVKRVKPLFTGGDEPYHLYAAMYYDDKYVWSMEEKKQLIPLLTDRGYLQFLLAHYAASYRAARHAEVAYLGVLRSNIYEVAQELDRRIDGHFYLNFVERELKRVTEFIV
ncbi:hypothetical protein [Exiguobacterium sp. 17-1]|uniref:hypothetical protein n=1 Tax=Exiguobacterium sp. 17-1 TaxID=2931981 RepID=UPI001FFE72DD|nr:hypothetical protein [Exiguobacterium sp. 17-1]MCK2157726.1 hypothetical protein [Exiguobacterium sp. 17-1]